MTEHPELPAGPLVAPDPHALPNAHAGGNPHAAPQQSIESLLVKLREKYAETGQNLESYLEGLLYQDYLNYWDYIHTDTLLSLQNARTHFPDEQIFIIYHQISELNFKMIISELMQISAMPEPDNDTMVKRVTRINRYFEALVNSFDFMSDGMDPNQFLRFRMALLPASGFQSAQFRMIEILCTDFANLVQPARRGSLAPDASVEELYEMAYWKQGATELKTGTKTLTLRRFEEKYGDQLKTMIADHAATNLRRQYLKAVDNGEMPENLRNSLRKMDTLINLEWRLVHFKSAMKYLDRNPVEIAATGGTNWQKYLPPGFQRNFFFPELWTDEERNTWGDA